MYSFFFPSHIYIPQSYIYIFTRNLSLIQKAGTNEDLVPPYFRCQSVPGACLFSELHWA